MTCSAVFRVQVYLVESCGRAFQKRPSLTVNALHGLLQSLTAWLIGMIYWSSIYESVSGIINTGHCLVV